MTLMATEKPSRNADGTYSAGFLLWEAELDFRVAAADLASAARALRLAVGADVRSAMTPMIVGVSMVCAQSDPAVAARWDAWNAAMQALSDAAWARAELDPTFDIRPFIGR